MIKIFLLDIEVLKAVIWPITVFLLVLIIILLLKKPLVAMVSTIKKISYGKTVAEMSQGIPHKDGDNKLLDNGAANKDILRADQILGLLSQPTTENLKIWVDNESKVNEPSEPGARFERLYKYTEALYLILVFERAYSQIFGSQIFILECLNSDIESKEHLKRYYDSAVDQNRDFFKTYSYDEYFDFLVKREFVMLHENDYYRITAFGRDFLKWIVESGRSMAKPY